VVDTPLLRDAANPLRLVDDLLADRARLGLATAELAVERAHARRHAPPARRRAALLNDEQGWADMGTDWHMGGHMLLTKHGRRPISNEVFNNLPARLNHSLTICSRMCCSKTPLSAFAPPPLAVTSSFVDEAVLRSTSADV